MSEGILPILFIFITVWEAALSGEHINVGETNVYALDFFELISTNLFKLISLKSKLQTAIIMNV